MEETRKPRFGVDPEETREYVRSIKQEVADYRELRHKDPGEAARQAHAFLEKYGFLDENGNIRGTLAAWARELE